MKTLAEGFALLFFVGSLLFILGFFSFDISSDISDKQNTAAQTQGIAQHASHQTSDLRRIRYSR